MSDTSAAPLWWAGDKTGRDPGTELNELRRAVAEMLGCDPDTWPDHGNAPLAIASHIALANLRAAQQVVTAGHFAGEGGSERELDYARTEAFNLAIGAVRSWRTGLLEFSCETDRAVEIAKRGIESRIVALAMGAKLAEIEALDGPASPGGSAPPPCNRLRDIDGDDTNSPGADDGLPQGRRGIEEPLEAERCSGESQERDGSPVPGLRSEGSTGEESSIELHGRADLGQGLPMVRPHQNSRTVAGESAERVGEPEPGWAKLEEGDSLWVNKVAGGFVFVPPPDRASAADPSPQAAPPEKWPEGDSAPAPEPGDEQQIVRAWLRWEHSQGFPSPGTVVDESFVAGYRSGLEAQAARIAFAEGQLSLALATMRNACILLTDDLGNPEKVLTLEKVIAAYTQLFDFLHTDSGDQESRPA